MLRQVKLHGPGKTRAEERYVKYVVGLAAADKGTQCLLRILHTSR